MSLIVLNSKGNDPEHFTNSMSSGIKIPCSAEVCLVSSNVQHKYIRANQVTVEAGNSTFSVSVGSQANAGSATRVQGADYSPHLPNLIRLRQKTNRYPIYLNDSAQITGFLEEQLNNTDNILQSNYTGFGAWAVNEVASVLTTNCGGTVPNPVNQMGDTELEDIIIGLGYDGALAVGASTNALGDGRVTQGLANYVHGVSMRGKGYYLDKNPIWNTSTGVAQGTWTAIASNDGVAGGGSYWDINPVGATYESIIGLKGGLMENNSNGFSSPTNNDNVLLTALTGGSNYAIWWEVTNYRIGGNIKIECFWRNIQDKQGLRKVAGKIGKSYKFAEITQPIAGASPHIRIIFSPRTVTAGANAYYCIDAGYARSTPAGVLSAPRPATDGTQPGFIKITDPFAADGDNINSPDTAFNLYQRLPLRQGSTIPSNVTGTPFWMSTIHHNTSRRRAGSAGISPIVVGTHRPLKNDFDAYNPDKNLQFVACRQNLGDTFGNYVAGAFDLVTAANIYTGGAGIVSGSIATVTPYNDCLVVQCPSLMLNGLLGNAAGDLKTGTLSISAGGNPAPILGVIPAPHLNMGRSGSTALVSNSRATFFAQPVDNWISLNNTTPFVINQLEIKITNSLGGKPNNLDGTSTITIKIREHKRTHTTVQGAGSNPQPINYIKPAIFGNY